MGDLDEMGALGKYLGNLAVKAAVLVAALALVCYIFGV